MNIVVHVPHASTHVPPELRAQFLLSAGALLDEAMQSADLYTDDLAQRAFPNATHIIAEVSRIVVDVERYEIDAEEVMAKQGRGVIYFKTHQGKPLRRPISLEERNKLIEAFYTPHWSKLKAVAKDQVLIDLHSYPVHPWPIELNTDANRPEIDIGTSDLLTPKPWLKAMIEHFKGAGYSVGVNAPYAGVIDAGAKYAVMIEIRRDLMNPKKNPEIWKRLISTLAQMPLPHSENVAAINFINDTDTPPDFIQPNAETDVLLQKLNKLPTWTNERRALFNVILKLIETENFIIFSGDCRTYGLQKRGSYKYMQVPATQRGTLAQFKGKWIRLICMSYSPKWPNHSGRIFAAKPIDTST